MQKPAQNPQPKKSNEHGNVPAKQPHQMSRKELRAERDKRDKKNLNSFLAENPQLVRSVENSKRLDAARAEVAVIRKPYEERLEGLLGNSEPQAVEEFHELNYQMLKAERECFAKHGFHFRVAATPSGKTAAPLQTSSRNPSSIAATLRPGGLRRAVADIESGKEISAAGFKKAYGKTLSDMKHRVSTGKDDNKRRILALLRKIR